MAFPYLNENGRFHIAKEREVYLTFADLKAFSIGCLRVRDVKMMCLGSKRCQEFRAV